MRGNDNVLFEWVQLGDDLMVKARCQKLVVGNVSFTIKERVHSPHSQQSKSHYLGRIEGVTPLQMGASLGLEG